MVKDVAEDFPATLMEFESRFTSEEACRQYLVQLRWPDGFVCPHCGGRRSWSASRGRIMCCTCQHQTSATAGTIFQDTRKPLRLWFRTMWYVTQQKHGASALGLQRLLGLSRYETAWTWLHKLRRAMVRPDRDRLSGRVEVDETFVGGDEEGVYGRQIEGKALVVIAVEERGRGVGRIRMARVADASATSLHPFIQKSIESGSTIHTDGWDGYSGIEQKGYRRERTVLSGKGKKAAVRLLPGVHLVAALLKRWLLGTHHGAVSADHLDYYLDEFTFRFNRRTSRSRGKLFYRLVQQAVQIQPTPRNAIVGGKPAG